MAMATHFQNRLLQDIAELQKEPYPRISLRTRDEDLSKACLVVQPEGWMPIHMTMHIGNQFPLVAPTIRMNTKMNHPNVFGSYICASILNTSEGYTPAYTLKGIAIQMLSFFNSDAVEQDFGGRSDLDYFRQTSLEMKQTYVCPNCDFDGTKSKAMIRRLRRYAEKEASSTSATSLSSASMTPSTPSSSISVETDSPGNEKRQQESALMALPDELVLETIQELSFEDLIAFGQAWPRVADIITRFDVIRVRELQCFVTKTSFRDAKLGVGVAVPQRRGKPPIQSEFDLISQDAFRDLGVRQSIHHIDFQHWLPLPLSRRHWASVRHSLAPAMLGVAKSAQLANKSAVEVLAAFMNDIIVRLNDVDSRASTSTSGRHGLGYAQKSTLRHASEKAIESYFHLFHLLLCLATENSELARDANARIQSFLGGKTSKEACPNLGHLLVYLLISDVQITERIRKVIIREAITRNVVWMLDKRGANMPELSYMEPSRVSHYRLKKTFEASRTSYRLLMFSELFRRIAKPSADKTLAQIRDELFDRHGAPPPGAALQLSTEVRRLHGIDGFPGFFEEMGIENKPTPEHFTGILRECVEDSMAKGYSVRGVPESVALWVRLHVEPRVGLRLDITDRAPPGDSYLRRASFFPGKKRGRPYRAGRR